MELMCYVVVRGSHFGIMFVGLRSHAINKSIAWAAITFFLSQFFHLLFFKFFNKFLLSD